MTSELKPCPFCGSEAETHETTDGWIVSCSSDQNVLDGFTHMAHAYGDTEAEAIDAWNKRYERTCKNPCIAGFMCSECGASCGGFPLIGTANVPWSYCPNCGRKVVSE